MAAAPAPQPASEPPAHIDAEEWQLRLKLAACYRIFDHLGWTQIIFNHITARVPGPDAHFLINPFGLRYDEVTASNLVKIDVEGNAVGKADYGVNPAGFIIHSAIHSHLDNAHWVMHTHTREGVAVSVKEHGLTNTNFYSAMLGDHVAYHDFEGLTVRTDECERLVKSIGDKPLIILRNHGLLTHGRSAEECFRRLWVLQQACETQVLSESMAGPDRQVTPEATENSTRDGRLFNSNDEMGGGLMFEALQRIIEVRDPTYRH